MNIYDKIKILKKHENTYYSKRIIAEIIYALKVSEANDMLCAEVVNSAADYLMEQINADGTITNSAAQACEKILMPISKAAKKYMLHCVGHAHMDMNWMWGFGETVAITLETFRTVLKLLKEYSDLTFSQSQVSTYKIAEQYDPSIFEEIKQRIAEGRWEVTASTWVESDKNMPSGESLVRQILYAKKYMKDAFNISYDDLEIDFEPDTFGHNVHLPEILSNGKVKFFYHCRGQENRCIYNWKAPSGNSVLVYQEPFWYNAKIEYDFIHAVPELCKQNGIDFLLKVYGVGDHGGGPTRRDIERLNDMSQWPIAPTLKFSTYRAFFNKLEEFKNQFPVVEGELNFIFTGCYSSQARIKSSNRFGEDNLFVSEAISAISATFADGKSYTKNYEKAWEKLLFNQFHDILPGSGIKDTSDYALGESQKIAGYTYAGRVKALNELAEKIDTSSIGTMSDLDTISEGGGVGFRPPYPFNSAAEGIFNLQYPERGNGSVRIIHLFNATQYERDEIVQVTIWDYPSAADRLCVKDSNGIPSEFVVLESGNYWWHQFMHVLVHAKIPPFGYSTNVFTQIDSKDYKVQYPIEPRVENYLINELENNKIKAVFNEKMELISLVDKATGEEFVKDKSAYFKLVYQNHRSGTVMKGNAWVEGYPTSEIILNDNYAVFITERTSKSLSSCICYSISFGDSNLNVTVSLDENSKLIKIKTICDFKESFTSKKGIPALKFCMPLNYIINQYIYKAPLGSITRESYNHDVPSIGSAYAINQSDTSGVLVLSNCFYGYRGENNSIDVTMFRASQEPDSYSDYGYHSSLLGVAICSKDDIDVIYSKFTYPIHYFSNTSHCGTLAKEHSFLKTQGDIQVMSVKLPENSGDGFIVRVSCNSDTSTDAKLIFDRKIKKCTVLNILEEEIPGEVDFIDKTVYLSLNGNQISTVQVQF